MNSQMKKLISRAKVRFGLPHLLAFGLLALGLAGWLIAGEQSALPDLTVHEWGTSGAKDSVTSANPREPGLSL